MALRQAQAVWAGASVRAIALALFATLAPAAVARAEPPVLAIESPAGGGVSANRTPSFRGVTNDVSDEVAVSVYAGPKAEGTPVQTLVAVPLLETWLTGPAGALPDGTYTAQATQRNLALEPGVSAPVTFTVDTTAPAIALSAPVSGALTESASEPVRGTAGTSEGDLNTITIDLFEGSTIGAQEPLEKIVVQAVGGHWSATFGGLAEGVYTVQAEQSDQAGNTGKSAAVTFTFKGPEPPPTKTEPTSSPTATNTAPETPPQDAPPVASFTWFPQLPQTGEAVLVVSNSTDPLSPIATLAWALAGNPFKVGGDVFTTSFATPGEHVVRLRVTAADGTWGTVTKTIPVNTPPATLMQPFPVVRIAGTNTSTGAKLRLITVQAPAGAHITVTCKGRGCPSRAQSRVVSSRERGVALVEFRRFERLLAAGAVLEIRVWKPGEIGKYTRFQIRRSGLPERSDSCLSPSGSKPMACPS